MKNRILIIILLFSGIKNSYSQELPGFWYSSDSSRVYQIKSSGYNKWQAVLWSSTRKDDKTGIVILENVSYNTGKKRLEGILYSNEQDNPVFAKIKFSKDDPDRLQLTLNRMFLFNVTINWFRVKNKTPDRQVFKNQFTDLYPWAFI